MNKFTKEELEDISSCIYSIRASSTISEMVYGELQEKTQLMIDNYVEKECLSHNLVRLSLLNKKEYDFCETCLYINRMR